jgi:uncharacterized repeat protein (TIGR01451 family)
MDTMTDRATGSKAEKARLIIIPSLLAAVLGFLLSSNIVTQPVQAFSSGPPAGYTGAPGEVEEACAECHVPPDAGTGHISISAPQTYVPGQTYQITVSHSNPDPTRLRWGFEFTGLDTSDEKAGDLQSLDGLTQVLNNAGPGSARQYIEHTAAGTFVGQQNGASWTFNWTAPATDIGVVTFYAAGNQANNDGNTSGDYIYRTFVTAAPFASTPDFSLIASPSLRAVTPGASAQYTTPITPSAGFTGIVNLTATGLPAGATTNFNPASLSITDATSKTAALTITTTAGTPSGDFPINITGTAGTIVHSAPVMLKVVSSSSVDLSMSESVSPNPGQVNVSISYRVTVTNNGPAVATNVNLTDTLPSGVAFGSSSSTQGSCMGSGPVTCSLNNLAAGASAIVTIIVTPSTPGQITNTATASASETDFDSSNNTGTINTVIQPAAISPTMLDPNLTVSTVVTGLDQPTSLAFLGANDFLVLEKASGKVQRVVGGVIQGPVLDLPVNSASERGLLGIALHPNFAVNHFVYLYWTESNTGVDSTNLADVALLGNRVDRYLWNGTALTFDRNLIRLRAYQADANQSLRGNHNGGVLRFGPDGKLYILMGDNGRRGFLQNNKLGPVPDDQYGGPEPDDSHLTGFILRLNDDGSTSVDNPFYNAATTLTGEAATNVKKLYAYGVRNGFGLAFDPLSGNLWDQENGDDAFDEMNRITAGSNNGWVETMGPISRVGEFKAIESTYGAGNLQQVRWPTSLIADTAAGALAQMYMLPGAHYTDPEFSWKYAVAPAAMGFIKGRGLGPQFEGDLLVGASRTTLLNGYLFRFRFSDDRKHFKFTDPLLNDSVADNTDKFDLVESETLVIGRDFGVATDIQTGPNGNVFVVSLLNGAVYEITSKPTTLFFATLTGGQQVPPTNSTATGTAVLQLAPDETTARLSLNFAGLSSPQSDAHIHGPAMTGSNAGVLFPLPLGQVNDFQISLTPQQVADLKNGLLYVNVHTNNFPNGEIRGQFQTSATSSAVALGASKVSVNEGETTASITVTRTNTAAAATVDYATNDFLAARCDTVPANASAKCDYTTAGGTLRFAAGESSKTIVISIIDDAFVEGNETLTISLSNPTGAGLFLGSPSSATITVVDNDTDVNAANSYLNNAFFVRQQYLDFLLREPDTAGYADWFAVLNNCGPQLGGLGAPAGCDRVHVSSGFFRSPEFGEKGYWLYRFYESALGRRPTFAEFMPEMRQLSGQMTDAEQEVRRADFIARFMQLPEFTNIYAGITDAGHAAQFIAKLEEKARVTLPASTQTDPGQPPQYGRQQLIDKMATGQFTAAQTLRAFIEQKVVWDTYFYRAFVAMQYFGYLRRDPEAAGYDDWVDVLTNGRASAGIQPGDYRHLIFGFIYSVEYRERFGKP